MVSHQGGFYFLGRALGLAGVMGAAVVAQAVDRADVATTMATLDTPGGAPRVGQLPNGDLTYLGAPAGAGFASGGGASPAEAAELFLLGNRSSFGVGSSKVDFQPLRESAGDGRTYVRFDQTYGGLPVFGAQALVQVGKSNRIESVSVDAMRHTGVLDGGRLSLTPTLSASDALERAVKFARDMVGAVELSAVEGPSLLIYAPEVIDEEGQPVLAYSMVIASVEEGYLREQFFVNAHTGGIAFHFNLIETAKNRQIYDSNNTSADPGSLVRSEGGPAVGLADANLAYQYFGDTYDFYFNHHGRDSIDGAGLILSATVRFCDPSDVCPWQNASWSGSRMYFGEGFAAADDVVGHELTHGVTQYTSNLIYANQSGALNESFSDVWGEFIDQTNSGGTDTAGVKWLLGEDVPGFGAIRSMKDPTTFGDPDSTCSANWYAGSADGGGVHTNSGVNNKLCYLLTDGDTFNSHTVTGMGVSTVAELYYEVQTNLLTQGSNYLDLYHALTQAAINLGLNPSQQANIEQACQAVAITDSTSCQLPPPPPPNDDCADAISITLDQDYTGNITSATGTETLNCGGNLNDNNDVWYTFAPPTTGTYTVTLCGSPGSTDTTLGIYTGNCSSHVVIDCDDESCSLSGIGVPSRIARILNQGTTYLIRVAGFFGAGGQYVLAVHSGDVGEGEGEGELVCNDTSTGSLDAFSPRWNRIYGAIGSACNTPSADSSYDDSPYVAVAFHADSAANLTAQVSPTATELFDTVLAVYCDPFDPLHPATNLVAYNDEFNGSLSGFSNFDGIHLTPGNTYWMVLSTFLGSSGGQLLDTGDYELCLGPNFSFGAAGSGNATCLLDTCPPFAAEGSGLYVYLSGLLSSAYSFDTTDLDATGLPEHFEVALARAVLCEGRVSWNEAASCAFEANKTALEAETSFAAIQAYEDVLAAMLSVGTELQTTVKTSLGLTGSYQVATSGAKTAAEDLSPNGDPDQDGYTNLQEYQNVIAAGGGEAAYVAAALNPLLDGTAATAASLPAAGLLGAATLCILLATATVVVVRRRSLR